MSKRTLTLIHGDKGGVGKSITANSVADYLISSGVSPNLIVVDSDQRNADVARMYPDRSHRINLLEHDGWNKLYDLIEAHPESDILVNLPAQAGKQISHEVEHLKAVLEDSKTAMVMFFTIDRLSDSVNLLTSKTCSMAHPISSITSTDRQSRCKQKRSTQNSLKCPT
jgi:cellulose biosynthesis protein BcsQ